MNASKLVSTRRARLVTSLKRLWISHWSTLRTNHSRFKTSKPLMAYLSVILSPSLSRLSTNRLDKCVKKQITSATTVQLKSMRTLMSKPWSRSWLMWLAVICPISSTRWTLSTRSSKSTLSVAWATLLNDSSTFLMRLSLIFSWLCKTRSMILSWCFPSVWWTCQSCSHSSALLWNRLILLWTQRDQVAVSAPSSASASFSL